MGNARNGALIGLTPQGRKIVERFMEEGVSEGEYEGDLAESLARTLLNMGFCAPAVRTLKSAYLHLTDRCNLECVGCYSFVEDRNRRPDLTLQQILDTLDQLASQGVEQLVLSGGEPMMRRDVETVVRRAKKHDMKVSLITNGTIAPKRFEPLLPYVDILNVSVDGYDKESRFIRDRGIMPRVLRFVEVMRDRTKVHLVFTLHHRNVPHMLDYVRLATDMGVSFNFSVFTTDPEDADARPFQLQFEDLKTISSTVNEADNVFIEDPALASGSGVIGLRCSTGCGVGSSIVSVGADGTVYPCHMLHRDSLAMGNILEEPLGAILERGSPIAVPLYEIEGCQDCDFRFLCGGGCRGRSFVYCGDAHRRDPFCPMTREYLSARTEVLKGMRS